MMKDQMREKRRAPRATVGSRVRVRIRATLHGFLANISSTGALIEHFEPMRLGGVYELTFQIQGKEVSVKARAVRSFISHSVKGGRSGRQPVYGTGFQFIGPPEEALAFISSLRDGQEDVKMSISSLTPQG